jgi:hypothetical protein
MIIETGKNGLPRYVIDLDEPIVERENFCYTAARGSWSSYQCNTSRWKLCDNARDWLRENLRRKDYRFRNSSGALVFVEYLNAMKFKLGCC